MRLTFQAADRLALLIPNRLPVIVRGTRRAEFGVLGSLATVLTHPSVRLGR